MTPRGQTTTTTTTIERSPVPDSLHQNLYIAQPLPSNLGSSTTQDPSSSSRILPNVPLFYLGLALIELCLNKPLSSLRDPKLDPLDASGLPNALTDWATATRLIDSVLREAGNRYGDAVRRCIYYQFDQRSTDLQNEAFRSAVHEGVIAPLEEVWSDFKTA